MELPKLNITQQHVAVAFALLCVAAPGAVKPYVDTFAIGLSYGKAYALAAYALLLAFSPVICRRAGDFAGRFHRHFSRKTHGIRFEVQGWQLALLIAALFAYGIFGHMYFVNAIKGELAAPYRAFDTRGYIFTYLNHIHALKTIFCPVSQSENFDCASSMLPYLPPGYDLGGVALALACVAACAIYYQSLERPEEKLAFFLLSFSTLKSAVDGGFFYYENLAFFMLVPFLLAKKNRLLYTAIGLALWIPFALYVPTGLFLIKGYSPMEYALPTMMLFYGVCIFAIRPSLFFPLLALALLSPRYLPFDSQLAQNRWSPEPCANAGADPRFSLEIDLRMYVPCHTRVDFGCGVVESNGSRATYRGDFVYNPDIILARGLSQACPHGVFSVEDYQGTAAVFGPRQA